jgi:hypothetical protein
VRAQARFLLRERGVESPLDLYRDALRQGHLGRLRCSAEELADHAGPEDAVLLRPLLDHADARVRGAALRGCLRLDPHVDEGRIARALDDDSAHVARVARSWLRRHASESLRRAMSAILLESPRPMARKRALRMLLHWGDRSSVSAVVEALDPQSPELQHEIVASLSALMLRRSVSNYPGVSVTPEVAQLIERRQALLGGGLALRLRNFFWEPR